MLSSTAESNAAAQQSSSAYAKGLGWAAIGLAVASSLAYKMVNSSHWTWLGAWKGFPEATLADLCAPFLSRRQTPPRSSIS